MKQIYNFECNAPPIVHEAMLRAEMEHRRVQRTTALLAVGSLLMLFCVLLLAILLHDIAPLFSALCVAYLCVAGAGGSAIALVYAQKRRFLK